MSDDKKQLKRHLNLLSAGKSPISSKYSRNQDSSSTSSQQDGIDQSNLLECLGENLLSNEDKARLKFNNAVSQFNQKVQDMEQNFDQNLENFQYIGDTVFPEAGEEIIVANEHEEVDIGQTLYNVAKMVMNCQKMVMNCQKAVCQNNQGILAMLQFQQQANEYIIEPLSLVLPDIVKSKRTPSRIRQRRTENFQRPWSNICCEKLTTVDKIVPKPLKDYTRKQIADYITEMQNKDAWTEPTYHSKGLRSFLQMYLGKFYKLVDEPTTLGLALSQLLWPRTTFHTQSIPVISKHRKSRDRGDGRVSEKLYVPDNEALLWMACLLYIGGFVFAKETGDGMDQQLDYVKRARETVNHRGIAEKKDPKNQTIMQYIPKKVTPLFSRGADWDDKQLYKDASPNELEECLNMLQESVNNSQPKDTTAT